MKSPPWLTSGRRLTALPLLLATLCLSPPSHGGVNFDGRQLRVDFEAVPLQEALQQLEAQTGVRFELRFEPPEDAALDGQFRLPLTSALRRLFAGFNFASHYQKGKLDRVVIVSLKGSGEGLSRTVAPTAGDPGVNPDAPPGEVVLQRDADGHYKTTVMLNGASFASMIDTGATVVTLSADVAQRLGVPLGIRRVINTANGPVEGHSTQLQQVQVGGLKRENIEAVVIPTLGTGQVLLGMNFLGAFELRQQDNALTLRPPQTTGNNPAMPFLPGFGVPPMPGRP